MSTFTFEVPVEKLAVFQKSYNTIIRRAVRRGLEQPTSKLVGYEQRTYRDEGVDIPYLVRVVEVEFEDWNSTNADAQWVATVDHVEGGNIIHRNPTWGDSLPIEFRNLESIKPECFHCAWERKRSSTVLLRVSAEMLAKSDAKRIPINGIIQVGSTCLEAYFQNSVTANKIKGLGDLVRNMHDLGKAPVVKPTPVNHDKPTAHTEAVMARMIASQYPSRAHYSAFNLALKDEESLKAGEELKFQPKIEYRRAAHAAMEWARNLEPTQDNDRHWNLKVIGRSPRIELSKATWLTKLWEGWPGRVAFEKSMRPEQAPAPIETERQDSTPYLRTFPLKETFNGTIPVRVSLLKEVNTRYGPRRLVKLETRLNETITVWLGLDKAREMGLCEGESYTITSMLPKYVNTYRGRKSLVVSKLKLRESAPVPVEEPQRAPVIAPVRQDPVVVQTGRQTRALAQQVRAQLAQVRRDADVAIVLARTTEARRVQLANAPDVDQQSRNAAARIAGRRQVQATLAQARATELETKAEPLLQAWEVEPADRDLEVWDGMENEMPVQGTFGQPLPLTNQNVKASERILEIDDDFDA